MDGFFEFTRSAVLFLISLMPATWAEAELPSKYPLPGMTNGKVAYVIDGDTFAVASPTWPGRFQRIRVRDIDTPEKNNLAKCSKEARLGAEATSYAKEVLPIGANVTLRNMKPDYHDERIDADVYLSDGTNYGRLIISVDLAAPWTKHQPKPDWCR